MDGSVTSEKQGRDKNTRRVPDYRQIVEKKDYKRVLHTTVSGNICSLLIFL